LSLGSKSPTDCPQSLGAGSGGGGGAYRLLLVAGGIN
jgi:hypothetical protein